MSALTVLLGCNDAAGSLSGDTYVHLLTVIQQVRLVI